MSQKNQELPHDLLSEKSLIGCLLIDGQSFDDIVDLNLKNEDFYHPKYGNIFSCIKDLADSNRPIDYVTVCSRLSEMGLIEAVGGPGFVNEIIEDQASSANLYHYAKTVKDKSSMRDIIRTAYSVAEKGHSFTGGIEDYVKEVEKSFFNWPMMPRLEKCQSSIAA